MTCIAFDGRTMAGDTLVTGHFNSAARKVQRVQRADGVWLVGFAGEFAACIEHLAWFQAGAEPGDFPDYLRGDSVPSVLLAVSPQGQIRTYSHTPYPVDAMTPHHAIGSGAPYAITAMFLGYPAREAVLVASVFDSGTGGDVQTVTL